jgi:hypothetical protein
MRLALALIPLLVLPAGALQLVPQPPAHNWEYLTYSQPDSAPTGTLSFLVGFSDKSGGLSLSINGLGPDYFANNRVTARLHRGSSIVEPAEPNSLNSPVGTRISGPTQWHVGAGFPWGANTLEESWIEVGIGKERYWLEVPYGFDRALTAPLPPAVPKAAGPKFAAAMKSLTERDHIVRWESVLYDLGAIHDGWRLWVIQSNPYHSETDVVLYRDDRQLDLDQPRTAVRIRDGSGLDRSARQVGRRLHDDGLRRSDSFRVGSVFNDTRGWASIAIDVGGKSYEFTVPSSVYMSAHGHAVKPQ